MHILRQTLSKSDIMTLYISISHRITASDSFPPGAPPFLSIGPFPKIPPPPPPNLVPSPPHIPPGATPSRIATPLRPPHAPNAIMGVSSSKSKNTLSALSPSSPRTTARPGASSSSSSDAAPTTAGTTRAAPASYTSTNHLHPTATPAALTSGDQDQHPEAHHLSWPVVGPPTQQLLSVAPMMDWTDVHYRELARMISRYKGVAMGVCVVEGGVYGYGEGGG